MTPSLWVDAHGRPRPTPVPARDPGQPLAGAYASHPGLAVLRPRDTWVEWCCHQQEVVLVPAGDGWYSEIPVLSLGAESTASGWPGADAVTSRSA
jgi:hypothetical protein